MTRTIAKKIGLLPLIAVLASTGTPLASGVTDDLGRSADDLGMEEFLRTATVTKSEEVGEGITKPMRLTLQKDDTVHRAIFKTVDIEVNQVARTSIYERNFSDKYAYEVAAYRVDRLVGLGLVPVTVLRTVDGSEGSLQLWIENITTMDRALEAQGNTQIENFDLLLERLMLTYILDALIYNVDRNNTNILIDVENDRFYPIDHSRAFRLFKKLPEMKDTEIKVPSRVAERLRTVDPELLELALADVLEPSQIKAVDKRRRLLVKELERRGLM